MTLKEELCVPCRSGNVVVNGINGQTKLDNIGRWNNITKTAAETATNFPLEKQKWPAGSLKS
jgi:hypothetical protein